MSTDNAEMTQESVTAWAKQRLAAAVAEVTEKGIFEGLTIEARPEWTLPHKIVIGRIRDTGPSHRVFWIIAGELPTDCIDGNLCASPREAARHFALKWQIGAEQILSEEFRKSQGLTQERDWEAESQNLTGAAQSLYQVVEADQVWG